MTTRTAPRLLVVDDEPEILAEVAGYLRRRGELVKTASSCEQALRALGDEAQPIDVLISDVRLQDGSGIELIRWARSRLGDDFPCILITGHLDQAGLGDLFENSAVSLIHKPFSLAAFYREVRAACTTARQSNPMLAFADLAGGRHE